MGIGENDEDIYALEIPEGKKRYILDTLNPLLEEMVTQVMIDLPPKPAEFMLTYLVNKAQTTDLEEHPSMTKNRLLKKKLARLKEQARKNELMKMELDKMEPPKDEGNVKFVPVVVKKNDAQRQRLRTVLTETFFCAGLSEPHMNILLDSMEEVRFKDGNEIISTDLDADMMFILEKGNPVRVKPGKSDTFAGNTSLEVYDVIGELDLMLDRDKFSSRIIAREECILWQMNRRTFNHVLLDGAAVGKRKAWFDFMRSVELVASVDDSEVYMICDALQVRKLKPEHEIFKQGEAHASFYIIRDGSVALTKDKQTVVTLTKGQFFGEEAFLNPQAKSNSISAVMKTDVILAEFSTKAFQRFFAGYRESLDTAMQRYK
jgi:cAMP-dependent protein kinase regulator